MLSQCIFFRQAHSLAFGQTLDAGADQQLVGGESVYGNAFAGQRFVQLNRHGFDGSRLLVDQPYQG